MKVRDKRLAIYFVVKNEYRNENDVSDDMQLAFMNTVDWLLQPKWIREKELDAIPNEKGNVFVFEEFDDEFINYFSQTHPHVRIVGPKCLLSCYMECTAIPHTIYPVYNKAMSNLVICTSKLPADEKKQIEKLVGYMGGDFKDPLTSRTTHLIVSSVLTKRHFIACEKGIKSMKADWVKRVWELNFKENVKATDYNIMKEFECPIFYNLVMNCSSLSLEEKQKLKEKISKNGGTLDNELQNNVTNILITPFAEGRKFKYATLWGIPCIKPAWIDECIKKGHTVPYDNYIVRKVNEITSTPVQKSTVQKPPSLIDTNESEISIIPSNSEKNIVNDSESKLDALTIERSLKPNEATVFKTPSKMFPKNSQRAKVSQCEISFEGNLSYRKILESIEINEVKKCGPIFDGCKLYLTGFNSNDEEKLRKVLNYGGALRFSELNESVTHIVVGNPKGVDLQKIEHIANKPHVVTLDWLCSSIKQKSLAKESSCAFIREDEKSQEQNVIAPQQPSPLSKKGIHNLNSEELADKLETPRVPVVDRNLIEKYSQSSQECDGYRPAAPAKPISQVTHEQPSAGSLSTLFSGLRFAIVGHDKEVSDTLKSTVIEYGGTVVTNFRNIVDYAVVPVLFTQTKVTSNEIVSALWLEDCLFNMKVVDVKYYHLPITSEPPTTKPLAGCVITLSSYYLQEKQYLENLAVLLGAKCQEILAKKDNADVRVLQTTHLICAQRQGGKYTAAMRWNVPIVTEMWIRDCFKHKAKLPLDNYLTNNAGSSSSSQNSDGSSKKSSQGTSRLPPQPCTKKVARLQLSGSDDEAPNFCAAATSTKIGDIMKEGGKGVPSTANRSLFKEKSAEPITPIVNGTSSTTKRDITSTGKVNKENETSKGSKLSNGPTSLLLEMNASSERFSSGVKRKLRSESSDRKPRSPKKKAICLDKRSLSPVEEIGWQDTLTDLTHVGGSSNSHSEPRKNSSQNTAKNSRDLEKNASDTGNTSQQKSAPPTIHRNFMLSVEEERKRQLENLIKSLGGNVTPTYESESEESQRATHLIIDELKKTEKFLCSIASGLWVLHSSYLDQCQKEGKFLPEENFEWGNPKNEKLTNLSGEIKLLACAAHRWRLTIQNGGPNKRPYVGMKIVFLNDRIDGHTHSLIRVVKSGGGQVLPTKEILKCTHCMVKSPKMINLIPVPLEVLASCKIHCLPVTYLKDYLVEHPPPDPKRRYLSEYQQVLKQS